MDVHQRPESTELELRAGFEDQSLPSLLSEERFGIKPLNTRGSPSISFVCIYSCCFFLWALSASSLRSSSPSEEPRSPVSVFRRANFVASPTSSLHHHQNGPYPGRPECRSTHCSHFSSSRTSSSCSSWKTLTSRVAFLLLRGYQPQNILCLTFTIKSCREMRDRIATLIGNGLEAKIVLGTFHSVCRRYLIYYGHLIGIHKNFGIADSSDSLGIIKASTTRSVCRYLMIGLLIVTVEDHKAP